MSSSASSSLLARILRRSAEPYCYQKAVADVLASGKNALVSVPTGAGKTWGALLPYLVQREEHRPQWDRVLYALPLRSLAASLWRSTVDGCTNAGFSVQDSERKWGIVTDPDQLVITIQTGEQRLDPFLTGDIIFLTIDQLLANYLNTPLSLPQKLSNINAGALVGSLVVLDEVHLLDTGRALATAIELATRLHGYAQVVVMTATLSRIGRDALAKLLHAEVVEASPGELAEIPSQADKQRSWRWSDAPLSAEAVLQRHNGERSLVLCNSVSRAQMVYRDLTSIVSGDDSGRPNIQLLHSRFYRDHRAAVEKSLPDTFGPDTPGHGPNEILVATQVVEAGIDISVDELHTEVCPPNSLIQRAGRCARYPKPRNIGTVTVYDLLRTDTGQRRLGPYRVRELAPLVERAVDAVKERAQRGQPLGFADEQNFLDETMADHEQRLFGELSAGRQTRQDEVAKTIDSGERSQVRNLIRDVDNLGVFIHEHPEQIELSSGPELLSVPRSALWGLRDAFNAQATTGGWAAKWPVEVPGESDNALIRGWASIEFNTLLATNAVVALHPSLAKYDGQLGLQLGVPGLTVKPPPHDPPTFIRQCLHLETFFEHAARTLDACQQQVATQMNASSRLDDILRLPSGTSERLAQIAAAFHDMGKLAVDWQRAICAWQLHKDRMFAPTEPLAHSDYDPTTEWKTEQAPEFRRPPHAVEGARAIARVLAIALASVIADPRPRDMAVRTVITAIARHHSGQAKSLQPYVLDYSAADQVRRVCVLLQLQCSAAPEGEPDRTRCDVFSDTFVRAADPSRAAWLPLYWFIARRLRLADQHAAAHSGGIGQ